MAAGNPAFDLYALSAEHQALRESVRALCAAKVAPYAADVDAEDLMPQLGHAGRVRGAEVPGADD